MARQRKKRPGKTQTLGDRIRLFRIAKGLTQADLAAQIGVPQQTITYHEVRGISPPPELLVSIADALDVSTDILLGRKKAPERGGGAPPRPACSGRSISIDWTRFGPRARRRPCAFARVPSTRLRVTEELRANQPF